MVENNEKMEIGEVSEIVTQMLNDDKDRMDLYTKIDKAVNVVFEPDPAVAQLPFVQGRKFALPDIADARNAGTRTFTSLLPDVSISPVVDNEGEYDRVDRMEQAWKWEMQKMNRPVHGKKGVHDLIVESAITYHSVALQTEFLPYKFKGISKDERIKAILRNRSHQWIPHHPGTVHPKYSEYGLESVAKVSEYSALELIQNFGRDNEGVTKLLAECNTDKKSELMKMKYTLVDFTNWKHRVQFAIPGGGNVQAGNNTRAVFMNELHGLSFIPWVIVDYGDPLWSAVIKSGHWNNLQHMRLIRFSKSIAMAGKPDFAVITPDGKMEGVWLDWKNPNNPLAARSGTQIQDLSPNKLDPQFETEYQEERADVAKSTVARILQDPTQYTDAPFSTFNAAITSALGQLAPAKRTAETAEAEAIYQGFQWIKHSKLPFNAYRAKDGDSKLTNGDPYKRGGMISIVPDEPPTQKQLDKMKDKERMIEASRVYFDLEQLYIQVELKSANITDEQSRMNTYINAVDRMGMSQKEVWDRMGWEGYDMNWMQRAGEQLRDAELQKMLVMKNQEAIEELKAQITQQVQAEMQAQQQAAAQQQQAQQQPQNAMMDMNAQSQFAGMQGADLRGGGMAAAQGAPNETRETITGQTAGGGQMI